jgi:nucleolar protein 56
VQCHYVACIEASKLKAFIIQYPFGVTAFDDKNALIEKVLFPKRPQTAASGLLKSESGKISNELNTLLTLLKEAGYDVFAFENAELASEVQNKFQVNINVMRQAEIDIFRSRMTEVAKQSGFSEDEQQLSLWNRSVSMELAKLRVKGASEKQDLIIAQAIQTIDDLDRTVNLFIGRTREWFGVYFPELDRLVEKHETYARLVMDLGDRENFTSKAIEQEGLPKERSEIIAKTAQSSMGADIAGADLLQIQSLSKNVLELYKLRENMEAYLEKTMQELAPNVRAVAGALLGARLIAIAGGLRNLAMRPASTIQVLGAEKALFRSLKTGARPPKHGLIFQHTLLHDAKRWQRGKIARVIAGKLSIAARADAFGGSFVGDRLKGEINKRLDEIREKYKEPPPTKEAKPKPQFSRQDQRPERRGNFGGRDQFKGRDRGRRRDQRWRNDQRAR